MKTRILSILMVTAILLSTAAIAQKRMPPKEKEAKMEMTNQKKKQFAERADFLTEEQKETVKKLRMETEKELKPFKNELREAMAHQQTLTTADNADLKAINKNIDKMSDIKSEMAKIKAKQHQAFRSQLTEEQLIKFDSRKSKMNHMKKNRAQGNRADSRGSQMHRRDV